MGASGRDKMTGTTFASIHKVTAILGATAALPLVFFVTSNLLKYELGALPEWKVPMIHPAILIGGIFVALIMNAWSIFDIAVSRSHRRLRIVVEITVRRWNLITFTLASAFSIAIVLYLFAENFLGVIGA